jgi:hypothetical protein
MGGRDDGGIRFTIDPVLLGGKPTNAPADPKPAKPDYSFRIMGQISSPSTASRSQTALPAEILNPKSELSDTPTIKVSDRELSHRSPSVRQDSEKISVRVPIKTLMELNKVGDERNETRSQILRRAIDRELRRMRK